MKITIIDYGMGNVGSIANIIKKVGGNSIITSDINELSNAQKLILPGVGSFDAGMRNLTNSGFFDVLKNKVIIQKTPILGICLGMQLMTLRSEEGILDGLGWMDANTYKFNFDHDNQGLRIPHMGWNSFDVAKNSKFIMKQNTENRFYFVHSYYVNCNNDKDVLAKTYYGIEFCSAFENDNIYGVQFHPEKSHKFGMQLFKNFLDL